MIDLKAKPFYLSDDDITWVHETLAGMSTEEKAGQLFCVLLKNNSKETMDYVFNLMNRRIHVPDHADKECCGGHQRSCPPQ